MKIDNDILKAVEKFQLEEASSTIVDMPSRVNKVFHRVTGLFGYIWNFLTFGGYFAERKVMIREALRGNNNDIISNEDLIRFATDAQRANLQAWGKKPTEADVNQLYSDLGLHNRSEWNKIYQLLKVAS